MGQAGFNLRGHSHNTRPITSSGVSETDPRMSFHNPNLKLPHYQL